MSIPSSAAYLNNVSAMTSGFRGMFPSSGLDAHRRARSETRRRCAGSVRTEHATSIRRSARTSRTSRPRRSTLDKCAHDGSHCWFVQNFSVVVKLLQRCGTDKSALEWSQTRGGHCSLAGARVSNLKYHNWLHETPRHTQVPTGDDHFIIDKQAGSRTDPGDYIVCVQHRKTTTGERTFDCPTVRSPSVPARRN